MNYKSGEFARLIGISVKTLQRWDRDGVLKANRTPTGQRFYTQEHLNKFMKQKGESMTKNGFEVSMSALLKKGEEEVAISVGDRVNVEVDKEWYIYDEDINFIQLYLNNHPEDKNKSDEELCKLAFDAYSEPTWYIEHDVHIFNEDLIVLIDTLTTGDTIEIPWNVIESIEVLGV